ncbi:cysteine dioxygenase [Catellatospora coxensis]|uniref:Cysteine dioxygenase n=1 Tax=Catellatospora coxensis TaxID=310354 RepID=A0A8J3L1Z0_9ACTN|nr:cysteine dioxygenase family protein [Catellatospora coxensis]GIG09794.1 cysteine dioxygenase [Catellatospora coxensis]
MIVHTGVRADHLSTARRLAADPGAWPVAPRFDPERRWYHRLLGEPGVEAWLLTWLPGQQTDLHDHGGSAGAFVVVSGTLTERTVTGPDGATRLTGRVLPAGAARQFGEHHLHQIVNEGGEPAVSVHVYGPELTTMTRYRLQGGRLRVAAVDRAGAQW